MGHLNSFSASGGGNLNENFAKNSNARGVARGGMLKLRFDLYIMSRVTHSEPGFRGLGYLWSKLGDGR